MGAQHARKAANELPPHNHLRAVQIQTLLSAHFLLGSNAQAEVLARSGLAARSVACLLGVAPDAEALDGLQAHSEGKQIRSELVEQLRSALLHWLKCMDHRYEGLVPAVKSLYRIVLTDAQTGLAVLMGQLEDVVASCPALKAILSKAAV
jgi:hypothetical protein